MLLDLTKCFDVICHEKLLTKLHLYNIHTAWFQDYLHGHSQQVKARCADGSYAYSGSLPVATGIFQGGSLSCLLFAIFANDMCLHVPDVCVVQFADDTQLLLSGKKANLACLVSTMERALDKLFAWFCANDMKVNASKSQLIVLGTRQMLRDVPPVSVRFAGTTVMESESVKNLGVTMDKHLTFQKHVTRVVSKCTGSLLALNHVKHVLPVQTVKPIVTSLVVSTLRYCLSIYGTCGVTERRRLQKVLNFCARVISGRRRTDHISDVLRELKWMTAENLTLYHRICNVRRIVETGQPYSIASTLQCATDHGHDTRRAGRLRLPQIRTETGRRQLVYGGVKAYNEFCAVYDGRASFKSSLRAYLLRNQWN